LTDLTPDLTKQEQQNLEKETNPQQQQHQQQLLRAGPVDIPDGKTQSRPDGESLIFNPLLCFVSFCYFLLQLNIF
jgi:hypothetical protein